LGRDARIAKLNGALAAAKSAAALTHAASRTGGGAHNAAVTTQGRSITMIHHYPTANTAGIVAAARLGRAGGFRYSGGGTTAASQLRIQIGDAPIPAQCSFLYQPPPTVNAAPAFTDIQTSGC
nr:hypothetical protein [Pseudomonadota bacterium]